MNLKTHFVLFFSLLLVVSSSLKAQSLKTYNGPFKVGLGFEDTGHGIYGYYEDKTTLERIKHGPFNYSLNLKNNVGGTLIKKITGGFKDGFKTGVWHYSNKYVDYLRYINENFSINATGEVSLTSSYKDGVPNGLWTYSNKISYRDKHYFLGHLITSPYVLNNNTTVTANFKDGYFCGPFRITGINYFVSGSFDSVGGMDGRWIVRTKDNEEISDFKEGYLIRRVNRALPNGEVLESEVATPELVKIENDYFAGNMTDEKLEALGYRIKNRNIFEEKSIDLTTTLFNDLDFIYTTLRGDKHIKVDNEGAFMINKILYFGGEFFKIEKK
jgi:hypothetical protein